MSERPDAPGGEVRGIGPVRLLSTARWWWPRWLDDELPRWSAAWTGLGMLALVALLWTGYVFWQRPAPQPHPPRAADEPRPNSVEVAAVATAVSADRPEAPVLAETAASAPLPSCPHQQLDLQIGSAVWRGCVGQTQTTQTGSIRTFTLEPEGVSNWRLRIDMAGADVIGVRLSQVSAGRGSVAEPGTAASRVANPPALAYACDDACSGFSLSAADSAGVKRLTARDVSLRPVTAAQARGAGAASPASSATSDAAASAPLRLNAVLAIASPRASAERCPVPSVAVLEGAKSSDEFCPAAGAGFEITREGLRRYQFLDFEGRALSVLLDAGGAIQAVSLGALSCTAPHCGGVSTQVQGPADSVGAERRFDFSGTALFSPQTRQHAATLTGSVLMPSQE